jgi:paraquat-inducible protein B
MKNLIDSKVHALKTGWYIWLFPVIALLISGWMLFDFYKQQGPRIYITFDDAGSIQSEKTKVRFRGVAIGTVKDVYISEDQKDVVAEILLRKDAQHFAVAGSKFSLVTPKVGFQGITGLDTLFEGAYIAVLPGPREGGEKMDFTGAASGATDPLDDTSAYIIETESVESINPGVSVTYRGLKVGSVSKVNVAKGGRTLNVQINVDNKYTWLIRHNTVFWRKVGVQAKLGLFGSDIKMNSMESIMSGGVELGTPEPAGPMAKALQKFQLAPAVPKDLKNWNPLLE